MRYKYKIQNHCLISLSDWTPTQPHMEARGKRQFAPPPFHGTREIILYEMVLWFAFSVII